MDLNATLITQTVVFFTLWWVVTKFIWSPLVKAFDERAKKIADGLATVDKGKAKPEPANKWVEQALIEARNKDAQRIADAEKRTQMSVEEIKQNVQAKTACIIAQAETEAGQQIVYARKSLRDQVAMLVVKGVEQILKHEVNAQVHADLLNQPGAEP